MHSGYKDPRVVFLWKLDSFYRQKALESQKFQESLSSDYFFYFHGKMEALLFPTSKLHPSESSLC